MGSKAPKKIITYYIKCFHATCLTPVQESAWKV